jgi:hypothetical protein
LFYAKSSRGEISKKKVKEWEEATPKGELPERLHKQSQVELPDESLGTFGVSPSPGTGYDMADLHLSDGRILYSVPILNGRTAVTDEDIHTDDIEHVEKVAAKKKMKKGADMVKYTREGAMRNELDKITGHPLGDSESSSATQFPYAPEAGPASRGI